MGLPAYLTASSYNWPDARSAKSVGDHLVKIDADFTGAYTAAWYYSYGYLSRIDTDCSYGDAEDTAGYALEEAYCAREGKAYCTSFPLRQTLVQPRIFDNSTDMSRIKALLDTPNFFGVPIDDATTLLQFCDRVNTSVLAAEQSIDIACDGCRHAVAAPDDTSAFGDWVHEHCPLTKVDATATVCIMSPSPKLYPYLLSYPQAKYCRRYFLSLFRLSSRLRLCYEEQFSGLFKRLLEALAYSALAPPVLAFLIFWALLIAQCERDEMDEDDELMYEAMIARPSTQGH